MLSAAQPSKKNAGRDRTEPTYVRSYSKINLGLAIGPPRPDGFHSLLTLYQTLALHDGVTVAAHRAENTRIRLTSNHSRVPTDARNTAYKMVERTLTTLGISAEVRIHIQKNLPIQGGMGAGSANAAAALLGLERQLALALTLDERLTLATQVGSDVPLFLLGGSVIGTDRGQQVAAVPDLTSEGQPEIACVIALPGIGVSTPQAFRDWDQQFALPAEAERFGLHNLPISDSLGKLSRAYASVFSRGEPNRKPDASGIFSDPSSAGYLQQNSPENLHGLSREQRHTASGFEIDLAENSLLALVRTGIENDFEKVVFPQYPLFGEIKRHLMGSTVVGGRHEYAALYAALSGSGSALFGLYRTQADAHAAQQQLQQHDVQAIVTSTIPRDAYWSNMFAE